MTPPPHLPYAGRAKWVPVGLDVALAGAGAALGGGVLAALGDESFLMRELALYTCSAVAATVVLALVRALTRELPTVRRTRFEGEDAWELRAWAADWWHSAALDAGLVVLAGWLCVLGARSGQDYWVPTSLVAVAGAWFLGRVLVSLLGVRDRQGLWLTEHEVVHDSPSGRARAPRSGVTDVTAGSVVPGVGTAVGAVVGTVVGAGVAIFADGAIDSLFENGPDVEKAWDEGVDALQDTGEAIADGVSSVGETIGGWFS